MTTYARTTRDFGTNADIVILSNRPNEHMVLIPTIVVFLLHRLIREGANGIKISTLHNRDLRALNDVETKLGLRLNRSRRAGHAALANTVKVIDQRTNREAA